MIVTSPCNTTVLSGLGLSGVNMHHMLRYTDVCMQGAQGSNPFKDQKVVKRATVFSVIGFYIIFNEQHCIPMAPIHYIFSPTDCQFEKNGEQ